MRVKAARQKAILRVATVPRGAEPTPIDNRICKEHASNLVPLSQVCERLRQEVGLLLAAEDIVLGAPIEARVKSLPSTAAKLIRQDATRKSIFHLTDLVGIRVIVLYRRDIERTLDLLRREFQIEREELKGMDRDDDAFGYQSAHCILACDPYMPAADAAKSECLRAELQVRTLAQHIWAAASHDLQYKREEGVPKPLRRAIQRVSALLETVDLELDRVLEEREEYVADAAASPGDFRLDVDILRKVLDDRLPPVNRSEDEPYSRLLDLLLASGVATVADLYRLIELKLPAVLERERAIVAALAGNHRWPGSARIVDYDPDRVRRGAFYSHTGLVQKMLETGSARSKSRKDDRTRRLQGGDA